MNLFRPSSDLPRLGSLSNTRQSLVSVLDIGSSKVCCMIARLTPQRDSAVLPGRSHSVEIIGFGHQASRGIKSGVVVDMQKAEEAIRLAVDAAERSAGLEIDSLIISVSAGRLTSDTFSSSIVLGGREVEPHDVQDVLLAGQEYAEKTGRKTVHALPVGFTLDQEVGISDPISMAGNELGVDMHVVTADEAPLRNVEACVNRSHLSVDAMVAAPYASGLAALVDDEAQMGSACIDMGGGTTSVSIFLNNRLVFADAVALGGHHVTMDLARVLSTPVSDAERLKVLHGSASSSQVQSGEVLNIPAIGNDNSLAPGQATAGLLARIIRPRLEETMELVRDRINRSGFAGAVRQRIVLTGGASQMSGVAEVAALTFGGNVRLGRPVGVAGMPKTAKGAAFAAAAGLLIYPQIAGLEYVGRSSSAQWFAQSGGGAFSRMGRWLKENF